MRSLNALIIPFLVIVFSFACRHSPTRPPDGGGADTTSHAMIWRTDTIGYGMSYGCDISIVNENDIWAVGSFYLPDSNGQLTDEYFNALHWDGKAWTPRRLYELYGTFRYYSQLNAVLAFSAHDIWVSTEGPYRFDGISDTLNYIPVTTGMLGAVNRFWGTSSSDLYMTARGGHLSHFDGTSYAAINTGVTAEFADIYGRGDTIYITSCNYHYVTPPSGLFRYERNKFNFLLPANSDTGAFSLLQNSFAVWISPTGRVWQTGNGALLRPLESKNEISGISKSHGWLLCMRGTADNDIWVAGVLGIVSHFNGSTWHEYDELASKGAQGEYHRMDVKGNVVALTGLIPREGRALVTIGKRMQ